MISCFRNFILETKELSSCFVLYIKADIWYTKLHINTLMIRREHAMKEEKKYYQLAKMISE